MNNANKIPRGFESPVAEPPAPDQTDWQNKNRSWWESNPMRYDWNASIGGAQFSREFFQEIDKRFFSAAAHYTPPSRYPFDELVPFDLLPSCDVLEIGVGNGSHAQLIAPHCKSYVGIDLTAYAVESTSRRFQLFNVPGVIRQMDAEKMDFADASFDFIWTWGVIHHSSNTRQILSEMSRILRPGGRAVVMVYHRSFLYYYVFNGFFRGVLGGGLLKSGFSLHTLVQQHTDGALARFYTVNEWREQVGGLLNVEDIRIMGQKPELLPLPASAVKNTLLDLVPTAAGRMILDHFGQGSFLVSTLRK